MTTTFCHEDHISTDLNNRWHTFHNKDHSKKADSQGATVEPRNEENKEDEGKFTIQKGYIDM
jgi:hypothetical protein